METIVAQNHQDLSPHQIESLEENGFLHLSSQFKERELKKLEDIFYEKKDALQSMSNWSYLNIFRESEYYQKFLKESVIMNIAKQLLGSKLDLFWDSIAIKTPDNGKAFLWHQDSGYGQTDPKIYFTFWIPLQKTTVNNGCLWVKPFSHKDGLLVHESVATTDTNFPGRQIANFDSKGEIPVEMKVGDLLVFHSYLAHRSGVNKSNENRLALAFAIHQRGFREFNAPPGLPEFPGLPLN